MVYKTTHTNGKHLLKTWPVPFTCVCIANHLRHVPLYILYLSNWASIADPQDCTWIMNWLRTCLWFLWVDASTPTSSGFNPGSKNQARQIGESFPQFCHSRTSSSKCSLAANSALAPEHLEKKVNYCCHSLLTRHVRSFWFHLSIYFTNTWAAWATKQKSLLASIFVVVS